MKQSRCPPEHLVIVLKQVVYIFIFFTSWQTRFLSAAVNWDATEAPKRPDSKQKQDALFARHVFYFFIINFFSKSHAHLQLSNSVTETAAPSN